MAESDSGSNEDQRLDNDQCPEKAQDEQHEDTTEERPSEPTQETTSSYSNVKTTTESAASTASEKPAASKPQDQGATITVTKVPPPPRCPYENLMVRMLSEKRPHSAWKRLNALSTIIDEETRAANPSMFLPHHLIDIWGKPATEASRRMYRGLDVFLSSNSKHSGRWFGFKASILLHDREGGLGNLPVSMSADGYEEVETERTTILMIRMDRTVKRFGDVASRDAWDAFTATADAVSEARRARVREKLYRVLAGQARGLLRLLGDGGVCRQAFDEFLDATGLLLEAADAADFQVVDDGKDSSTVTMRYSKPKTIESEDSESGTPTDPSGDSSKDGTAEWDCDEEFDFLRASSTRLMVKTLKMTQKVGGLTELIEQQAEEGERILGILKKGKISQGRTKLPPKQLAALNALWRSHYLSMHGTRELLQSTVDAMALAEKGFTKLPGDIAEWNEKRAAKLAANEKELQELNARMEALQVMMDEHETKDHAAEAVGKIRGILQDCREELGEVKKRRELREDSVHMDCRETVDVLQHDAPDAGLDAWPSEVAESEGSVQGVGWEDVVCQKGHSAIDSGSSVGVLEEMEWDV